MNSLEDYAHRLAELAGLKIRTGEIFAKVLTQNDDAGRHGVLVPIDIYAFFPQLEIKDPKDNATTEFTSFDANSGKYVSLAFKYYQRYPERRITRLNPIVNDFQHGKRLQIFLRGEDIEGNCFYIHDAVNESVGGFLMLWDLVSAGATSPELGVYLNVPIKFKGIEYDKSLNLLLDKFDDIRGRWHDSRRLGDTGIGYTFESLLGIEENNAQIADFHGIELKCKRIKGGGAGASGKLNLFQLAPVWDPKLRMIAQLQNIGRRDAGGLLSCHSQVTTIANNLALRISESPHDSRLDLQKDGITIGYWLHGSLKRRLEEKHSRSAFVLASVRTTASGTRFNYQDLIYCERPAIHRFLDLVRKNQLVFEFLMSEKIGGRVRNHGYPWRLVREELLDELFAVRVKLR